jgi:hypothetical protein
MRHDRLKKAVEKYAEVKSYFDDRNCTTSFHAVLEGNVIRWFIEEHDPIRVICLNVRSETDKDEFQSDYHAGCYHDTIKSAISSFTYDLQEGEQK